MAASSASQHSHSRIITSFTDGLGVSRRAPESAVRALAEAIESTTNSEALETVVVLAGSRTLRLAQRATTRSRPTGVLRLEDGGELQVSVAAGVAGDTGLRLQLSGRIPLGVHRLLLRTARTESAVLVLARPKSLAEIVKRSGRQLALFLPLHAVVGEPFGVGTYGDLEALTRWAATFGGARFGTLPLFAAYLDEPFDPSPYAPVSRLMWNELFIDPRQTSEWREPGVQKIVQSSAFQRQAGRAKSGRYVDYHLTWKLARRALKAMSAAARNRPRRWSEIIRGLSLETGRYALFRAAVDATRSAWDQWPATWRSGRIDASQLHPGDIDLYVYAQAIATEQIRSIRAGGSANPLYLDLPIGVHAHGYETFAQPDLFLNGVSAGAPPDGLNASGQSWGFPPMHPTAGRLDGYAHLRAILRQMLSVAGVLRIDHVMGLYRMYCIPRGHDSTQGAYIRYPEEELFAVVMIEAARAGAVVVGEDLGTVPRQVRALMGRFGLLGMHVQQFALATNGRSIRPARPGVLASLNTHDTPGFAAFWNADDVKLRLNLGHVDSAEAKAEAARRRSLRRAVSQELGEQSLGHRSAREAALSLMRLQARGRAQISLVNLEDLWGEREPQNVPGTSFEYPNWRRRVARPLRVILHDRQIAEDLRGLARERRMRRSGPAPRRRARPAPD
jgi:4-alpha-glucanotransferase